MTPPNCPRCNGKLSPVESRTLWSQHVACGHCRVAFIWDMGILTVCKSARTHVINWPDIFRERPAILPPVQAGPIGTGVL